MKKKSIKSNHNGNGHNLKLDSNNARKHSDRNQALVKQSLETVGAFRSVGADADGIIRVGNQTFKSAQELGYKIKVIKGRPDELIVVQRDDLKGKDAVRAGMLDNLSADSSYADYDAKILSEIQEDDNLLAEIFQQDARILALVNSGGIVQDPSQEWQGMPEHISEEIRGTAICCLVRFRTEEDRNKFEDLLGYKLSHKGNTYTTWYPKQDFDQLGRGTIMKSES